MANFSIFLLLSICLGLLHAPFCVVEGYSIFWGHVNKYSATIHTEDVLLRGANDSKLVFYPGKLENSYTITAMHVYDASVQPAVQAVGQEQQHKEAKEDADADVQLVDGGIGYNYTVVRFQRAHTPATLPYLGVKHFRLSIYGLDLQ